MFCLIVFQFLIVADIGSLGFVAGALQPLLAFSDVDTGAVGRDGYAVTVGKLAQVFLLEQVAELHLSAEAQVGKSYGCLFGSIVGIIDGEGAFGDVQFFNVSHQNVTAVGKCYDVCLLIERILIEGYQFFVFQQIECCGLDVFEVAAYEQWRIHDTPHAEVGLVFLGSHGASHLEHVHVVEAAVVAVGTHV